MTAAAYLLFYRRREEHPLGGPILTKILEAANTTADSEEAQVPASREPSPQSGEGRRLGDSSHNGSSSAFAAGQTHRVGDGGPAVTKTMKSKGMTGVLLEDGSPLKSVETTNNDEELPRYSRRGSDPGGMEQHFSRNMGDGFEREDSGIEADGPTYGPPWQGGGWSFNGIVNQMAVAPPGSPDPDAADEDLFQDSNSTKVEDGDDSGPHSPWDASDEDLDPQVHELMDTSGMVGGRGMRESAPPPDGMDVDATEQPVHIVSALGDDDDEDLPVVELRGDEA